ncbi:hypothetical protein [Paraburkholderia sp. XV]|nr:hypothetical protein [Paraburkholderia sp. XV]
MNAIPFSATSTTTEDDGTDTPNIPAEPETPDDNAADRGLNAVDPDRRE